LFHKIAGWFAIFSLLSICTAGGMTNNSILEIRRKIYPQPEKSSAQVGKYIFHSAISQKNLLGLQRKSLFSLPEPSSISAQPVTIRILAVRVAFLQEIPDDPTTTGDGTFDFRPDSVFFAQEGHQIDPSPHNKEYSESHLQALKNYWEVVSEGKLNIVFDVFPAASDVVYELPRPMAYYGSQRPDSGLAEFFKDTWNLVDQLTPSIDFSQYQSFVIFHAGSDQQSNLSFSPTNTPNDLFTGFIVMGNPVPVDGGVFEIGEGLIIPETVSQDTRIGALNAVLAHEFGHQLGLVDLYKTYDCRTQRPTFTTQVGDFSLMDNNATDVGVDLGFRGPALGTLPVYPDAWSRAYLGFEVPVEIQNKQDVLIKAAALLSDSTQIVKIPINSQEYFLLENRNQDLDGDGRTDLRGDPVTGVVLGPGKLVGNTPVLTREYDALLPGSGMLIWHVDEGEAYLDCDGDGLNNFLSNQLQGDKERRFVSVEEADGIIDFGGDYYTGFGTQADMYYRENNSAFTPATYPSSRSNTGADTHIKVTGIGRRDTIMQCDISVDLFQAGWPQEFRPASNTSSLVAYDVDGDTVPELFLASGNRIYAWKKDGSRLIANQDVDSVQSFDGQKTTTYPAAIFAETDAPIVGPPAIADLVPADTIGPVIVAGTESAKVYAWVAQDRNGDGRADLLPNFPVNINCSKFSQNPVISNFLSGSNSLEILAICSDGALEFISISGESGHKFSAESFDNTKVALSLKDSQFYSVREGTASKLYREDSLSSFWNVTLPSSGNFTPVVSDLNRNGAEDVLVASRSGFVTAIDSAGNILSGFPVNIGGTISSKPVLGDIDGDGHLEILLGGDNKIWALNFNGTVATDFPIVVDRASPVGFISTTPILVDINADGNSDVLIGSPGREILAYSGFASKPAGFPLSTAAGVLASGTVVNFDRSGGTDTERELAFPVSDGFVYVWNIIGNFNNSKDFWLMEDFDAQHSNRFPSTQLPPPPVAGIDLLPPGSFYPYPNPATNRATLRFYLNYDSQVELKFFDLAGNLVDSHKTQGTAFTDNEFDWDCSGLASGVYVCRIQAKGGGKSQTEFCKIAVVK